MEKAYTTKQELRNRYLSYRNGLSAAKRKEKSEEIQKRLKQEPAFQKAEAVLVYMDYRSEVETSALVEELLYSGEKRIFAPKVEGMNIRFYEIISMEDLKEGYQGIREPEADGQRLFTQEMSQELKTLILVPGAVFDRQRGRMGYGKGFYDRYLAAFPALNSVALAFECQIAKKVPEETHDKKTDMIITEAGVIK